MDFSAERIEEEADRTRRRQRLREAMRRRAVEAAEEQRNRRLTRQLRDTRTRHGPVGCGTWATKRAMVGRVLHLHPHHHHHHPTSAAAAPDAQLSRRRVVPIAPSPGGTHTTSPTAASPPPPPPTEAAAIDTLVTCPDVTELQHDRQVPDSRTGVRDLSGRYASLRGPAVSAHELLHGVCAHHVYARRRDGHNHHSPTTRTRALCQVS